MRTCAPRTAVPVVLALALVAPGLVLAQGVPPRLPASASPPPEVREMEQLKDRIPAPASGAARAPSREEILQMVQALPGGAERLQQARGAASGAAGRPLPPSQSLPADIAELERRERQLPAEARRPAQPPSREEILQRIRELPGGAERLEQARRRGAQIPPAAGQPSAWISIVLRVVALVNPFHVEAAQAQGFRLWLTPESPTSGSPNGYIVYKGDVWCATCRTLNVTRDAGTEAWTYPTALLSVSVPTTGWYVLSFSGYAGNTKATLYHWVNGTGYTPVGSWDYSTRYERLSFPVVLELAAGRHTFYFKPTAGWVSRPEVAMYSLF